MYLSFIRLEYLSQNISREVWLLLLPDLSSIRQILFPDERRKSISYANPHIKPVKYYANPQINEILYAFHRSICTLCPVQQAS